MSPGDERTAERWTPSGIARELRRLATCEGRHQPPNEGVTAQWLLELADAVEAIPPVEAARPQLSGVAPVSQLPSPEAVEAASLAMYEMTRGAQLPGVIDGVRVHHVGTDMLAIAALRAAYAAEREK